MSTNNKKSTTAAAATSQAPSEAVVLPFDSDEHDDFNPIQDLMPAFIASNSDLD